MSTSLRLSAVAAAVLAAACGGPATKKCGAKQCTAEQRCDTGTLLCVQDEAPVVTLAAVGGVVTGASFTVTGTAVDDVAVKKVEWTADDGATWTETTPDGTALSVAVPLAALDSRPLAVRVRATDELSQAGEATVSFTVDNVAPAVTVKSPTATVRGTSVDVVVTATDGSGSVASVSFTVLSSGAVLAGQASGSDWRAVLPLSAGADLTTIDLRATAADGSGNARNLPVAVSYDNKGPTGTVTSPTDAGVVRGTVLTATGTVVDPVGVAAVRLKRLVGTGSVDAGVAANVWSGDIDLPQADGAPFLLEVELEDAVGNTSPLSQTFTVDNVAPAVTFVEPAVDALLGGPVQTTRRVAATVTGAATAVTVQLGAATPIAATAEGNDVWAATVSLPLLDYSAQTLTVRATDAAGNEGTATRRVYIDRVAPVVSITTPLDQAKVGVAGVATNGTVPVTWTVTDGDAAVTTASSQDGTTWTPGPSGAVQTQPTDNPQTYTARVRATDTAGNQATASRTFSVDRVAPTVTAFTPANDVRNVEPREASVAFNEPVQGPTPTSDALTVTPPPPGSGPGTWNGTHSSYTTPALAPYTVYTAIVAANVRDEHGNPVASPASRRFHTVAATPASGATVAGSVASFTAASDSDGLVTIGFRNTSGDYAVSALSPTNGQLEATALYFVSNPGSTFRAHVSAWTNAQSTLAGQRIVGAAVAVPSTVNPAIFTLSVYSRIDTGPAASQPGTAFVPSPAISAMGLDGTGTTGLVSFLTYSRAPSVSVPLNGAPSQILSASTTRWAAFRPTGTTGLAWDEYGCNDDPTVGWSCFVAQQSVTMSSASLGPVSTAMSPRGNCLGVAFDGAAGRRLAFQGPRRCPLGGCASRVAVEQAASTGLKLAPFGAAGEDSLLAAWDTGSAIQLGKYTTACTGASVAFTPVGAPGGLSAAAFHPVQLGNKPALLYLDGTNLKAYVP
ncbi:MAG: Ig-like domain repeat protein [Deltaproteobacteria bacterium]|nr:Ig-like domain repeat protein [Deltaproteobacteria bacterium]